MCPFEICKLYFIFLSAQVMQPVILTEQTYLKIYVFEIYEFLTYFWSGTYGDYLCDTWLKAKTRRKSFCAM